MARKVYSSPSINVSFDAAICIHSAMCLNGLPQVFDLDSRPWISPDAAAADEIAAVVERCPSGALQYERLDGAPQEQADASTIVDPIPNGPLMVRGAIDVRGADGQVIRHDTRVTLCRCGGSANKPFCDNTHRRNGFTAD
jgi:uncharacterized Fe-S cluster protein YjdI